MIIILIIHSQQHQPKQQTYFKYSILAPLVKLSDLIKNVAFIYKQANRKSHIYVLGRRTGVITNLPKLFPPRCRKSLGLIFEEVAPKTTDGVLDEGVPVYSGNVEVEYLAVCRVQAIPEPKNPVVMEPPLPLAEVSYHLRELMDLLVN